MKKILAFWGAVIIALNFLSVKVFAEFIKNDEGYVYIQDDGTKATGFTTIGGDTYYFQKNGIMKTGWIETKSGKKYYF